MGVIVYEYFADEIVEIIGIAKDLLKEADEFRFQRLVTLATEELPQTARKMIQEMKTAQEYQLANRQLRSSAHSLDLTVKEILTNPPKESELWNNFVTLATAISSNFLTIQDLIGEDTRQQLFETVRTLAKNIADICTLGTTIKTDFIQITETNKADIEDSLADVRRMAVQFLTATKNILTDELANYR